MTISPVLTRLVKSFLAGFLQATSTGNSDLQHHQLYGSTSVRIAQNALKIKDSILHHCGVNVFTTNTELKTIASATVIPESAKKDIIEFASKGQERLIKFVKDNLLSTSTGSVWDTLPRLKLKTFLTHMPKTTVKLGETVVKLREESQLLVRFLAIIDYRPDSH